MNMNGIKYVRFFAGVILVLILLVQFPVQLNTYAQEGEMTQQNGDMPLSQTEEGETEQNEMTEGSMASENKEESIQPSLEVVEDPEVRVPLENADEAEKTTSRLQTASVTATGYNLYRGEHLDDSVHMGTYATWTALTAVIKTAGAGTYAIDLTGQDLSLGDWRADLAPGTTDVNFNTQNELNFYSSTSNKLTFQSGARMGAHTRLRSGLVLVTPTSGVTGPVTFINSAATGYADATISANGWRFVVDKGVAVSGYANLYAGLFGATFDFYDLGRTVLQEEGESIRSGYVEVNAGKWRTITAGASYNVTGAYRLRVGIDDDPDHPVEVDTVIGQVLAFNMYPITPDPNIATEYLEVAGNTIVKYGVAISNGAYGYYKSANAIQLWSTHKVIIRGNASILGTIHGVEPGTTSDTALRISVSADSSADGYVRYTTDTIVNNIIEISDNAYIAGDVLGNGPNIYYNVNNNSKGTHINIKDRAQIGGNILYGGSSSAGQVVPTNDSDQAPFFSIIVQGAAPDDGVKIGGSILGTNGEDNSNQSSWSIATEVKNAVVNGSVIGYGNLANESYYMGIKIKSARMQITDSSIGGGVYGVATGSGSTTGATQAVAINIERSTVGHVAPLITRLGNASNYGVGTTSVTLTDSVVTGKTVMWSSSMAYTSVYQMATYAFVGANGGNGVKAMASVTVLGGGMRSITFNTDGIGGMVLPPEAPDISLTASMNRNTLGGYSISLKKSAEYPGMHSFTALNTNFTRDNANPLVLVIDQGDGSLGTRAEVTVDGCYATAAGRKIDAAIFGTLTDSVTVDKIGEIRLSARNGNDYGNIGIINNASSVGSNYINTMAKVGLTNTVVDAVFGRKGSTSALRNTKSDINRIQFEFVGDNTVGDVLANGADMVFLENSNSLITGKFNNTGATVYDNEWIDIKNAARLFLGKSGAVANKNSFGGASIERVFGSVQGHDGAVYIYKDTSDLENAPNATYPIYIAQNGQILSSGMNIGEWSGTIDTAFKQTEFDAVSGRDKQFAITHPDTSDTDISIQRKNDILMVFETVANAVPTLLNDVPLRPWPITNHETNKGWLILDKPRYQITYQGMGYLQGTTQLIAGKVEGLQGTASVSASKIVRPGLDSYQFIENEPYYIENDGSVTARADSGAYRFAYWTLYSGIEKEENGVLYVGDWQPSTAIANPTPPTQSQLPDTVLPNDGNIWLSGNAINLEQLMRNGLPKTESKMLMLVPVYVSFVCKINDTGYASLEEAMTAVVDGTASSEPDGSYVIEMLTQEYRIDLECTIPAGKQVVITTASATDLVMPYRGAAGTQTTLLRGNSYKGAFFKVEGSLGINAITLDGNNSQTVAEAALVAMENNGHLRVDNGTVLTRNKTTSLGSAIEGVAGSTIQIWGGTITSNETTNTAGGGVYVGAASLEVQGVVTIKRNWISIAGVPQHSNIRLIPGTTFKVTGNLKKIAHVGVRVADEDHVKGKIFAYANSEAVAAYSYHMIEDDRSDTYGVVQGITDLKAIQFEEAKHLTFFKISAADPAMYLKGASFELYELICVNSEHDHSQETDLVTEESINNECWTLSDDGVSGVGGYVDMGAVLPGEYQLVETEAPLGYQLPEGQWRIHIGLDETISTITARKAEGDNVALLPVFLISAEGEYKLPNIKSFELPFSGKSGTTRLIIIGGCFLAGAYVLYRARKHVIKKEEES